MLKHAPGAKRRLEVRDSLAALRLIVEGLRDDVIDAATETGILDQMMLHVLHLSELLDDELRAHDARYGAAISRPVCGSAPSSRSGPT